MCLFCLCVSPRLPLGGQFNLLLTGIYRKGVGISHLRPFRVQGLRNANYRERTTQKAHADMYNTRNLPLFRQREARMYINTHQEDVFVAVSHSDRSKFAKFWTQMTNACKRLLNINVSPSPPGGFLRKRPLQMYKKIRLEMVMWIRNFLNAGCFALFLPFFCPLPGEMRLHWHLVRKRRVFSILGTKRALNYKSRGIIPRLIFFFLSGSFFIHQKPFLSYQEALLFSKFLFFQRL